MVISRSQMSKTTKLKPPKHQQTLSTKGFAVSGQGNKNEKRPEITKVGKLNLNLKKNKSKTLFPETVKKQVEV